MAAVIGVDLGGTFVKAGIVQGDSVLCRERLPSGAGNGAEGVLASIRRAVENLMEQSGLSSNEIEGLGMAVPSQISPDRRMPIVAPNIPCIRNVPLAEKTAEPYGWPSVVENDASAAALGEWFYGLGTGTNDLIVLTLGTGVGGGVISGGQLLRGPINASGELGHILVDLNGRVCGCGRRGCLEGQISIGALVERGRALCPEMSLDAATGPEQLANAARAGNSKAHQVFQELGRYLGIGIGDLVSIFGPDLIVLGGGVSQAFDLFEENLWSSVRENCRFEALVGRLQIKRSALGGDAAILGAAAAFRDWRREQERQGS